MFLYGVSFVYDVGLGRPEEKPSTSESLPVRLRELAGKLGWMKWEPVNLTGYLSGGRRSPCATHKRRVR